MSYFEATGDNARYTLLTNGCWDKESKAYVDKALCATPLMPAASIGSGFGLPGWLLPVGIGVAAFLYFKSRGGPKQNPARSRWVSRPSAHPRKRPRKGRVGHRGKWKVYSRQPGGRWRLVYTDQTKKWASLMASMMRANDDGIEAKVSR